MLKKYHVEDKLYDPFKSCKKDFKKKLIQIAIICRTAVIENN